MEVFQFSRGIVTKDYKYLLTNHHKIFFIPLGCWTPVPGCLCDWSLMRLSL